MLPLYTFLTPHRALCISVVPKIKRNRSPTADAFVNSTPITCYPRMAATITRGHKTIYCSEDGCEERWMCPVETAKKCPTSTEARLCYDVSRIVVTLRCRSHSRSCLSHCSHSLTHSYGVFLGLPTLIHLFLSLGIVIASL